MELQEVWRQVMGRVQERVSSTDFGCWLQPIRPLELCERRVYAEVPSAMHLEQVRSRFQGEISGALAERIGAGAEIVLAVNKGLRPTSPPRPSPAAGASAYTFDTFVVGSSNTLAHASARDVADRPGAVYNPLFLYGGVGLGKTHLANAIANHLARGPYRRVAMLSAEAFANDMIRALVTNAVEAFRAKLRHLDVLIVDDVQFLAGKERMQEEFFHTFNSLHAAGRQIVLASDQPPRSIRDLELRLQNRFESGLTAEIGSPEAPLRLAILAHKARAIGFDLPLEVAQWVASKVVSSVRELEGALHRLVAACRCGRRSLDLRFAVEVLRPILRSVPPCTLEQVQRLVAENFPVTPDELVQRGGSGRLRVPRQVAMYLARKRTSATYAEIAAGFGGRDHSTVMHAVKCVEARRREEPEFAVLVDRLVERLASA